jgi:mannitol-1-/sugar-/sorbitol-6-phosphatase
MTGDGMAEGSMLVPGVAVLFDCDGVLVASLASVDRAWSRWSTRYGLDPDEVAGMVHGRRSADTVALLIEPAHRAEAVAAIDEYELQDAASVTAIAGARELVACIPDDAWAVVTSGKAALARARLEAAGIDAPDVFIAADDVEHGKPEPDPYLSAAAALGVRPRDAIVVEDSPSGVESGRRAGAGGVVGVGSQAVDTDADVVVPDLRDLAWSPSLDRSSEPGATSRLQRSIAQEESSRGPGLLIPRRAILPRAGK